MAFFRRSPPSVKLPIEFGEFQPELRVIAHIATRKDEPERGPQVRMCGADARFRVLTDGELVWVRGPRGQQVAELVIDDEVPEHACILRDMPSVSVGDAVRVVKPDLDSPRSPRTSV
jgi:anaerobic selenocysteine-containing dehydrogenase